MRLTISWRDGAYYVDKSNFHGGQVITVEAIQEDAFRWAITMRDAADEIERLRGTLVLIANRTGQSLISATCTDCDAYYSRGANAAFEQAAELAQTALDFKPSI